MSAAQPARLARDRQRQQILSGLLDALERRGPAALRESDVIEAAGVPAEVFHRHFRDLEECFDSSCEAALDVLLGPMVAAWSVPRPRPERLGASLDALLGALAAQPRLAALCLLHAPARQADRRTHDRAVNSLAAVLVDVRRPPSSPGAGSAAVSEEALARGAVGLIAARLADSGGGGLRQLRPQLLSVLVPALELDAADWTGPPERLD